MPERLCAEPRCGQVESAFIHKGLWPHSNHKSRPTTGERLCAEPGCGHVEASHFDTTGDRLCSVGAFCKECPVEGNVWEHHFRPHDRTPSEFNTPNDTPFPLADEATP